MTEPSKTVYRVEFDILGDEGAIGTIADLICGILPRIFPDVDPRTITIERKEEK